MTYRYDFRFCCFIICSVGIIYSLLFILFFIRNIKENIEGFLKGKKEEENIELDGEEKNIYKEILNNESSFDEQNLNKSAMELNYSFLGNFRFESFTIRRHHFSHKYRKRERTSKLSLYSSLTN